MKLLKSASITLALLAISLCGTANAESYDVASLKQEAEKPKVYLYVTFYNKTSGLNMTRTQSRNLTACNQSIAASSVYSATSSNSDQPTTTAMWCGQEVEKLKSNEWTSYATSKHDESADRLKP